MEGKGKGRRFLVIALAALFFTWLLASFSGCVGEKKEAGAQGIDAVDVKWSDASGYRKIPDERLELMLGPEKMGGGRAHNLSPSLFSALPAFPPDLHEIALLVNTNYFSERELAGLDASYWKQPEFYPGFWLSGVEAMGNPPGDRWGASGMRGYPAEHFVSARPGEAFTSANFFASSWLVVNRQAVSLEPRAAFEGGVRSGEDAARYFSLSIEPREFLLGASWPVFEESCAQKVVVRGNVAEDAPPGDYAIYFDLGQPSQEAVEKWDAEGRTYISSSSFASAPDRPYYVIHVSVRERAGSGGRT
ncbi:Uncharacterised protein [Candidatus Burarchaeum australiense]|nr:Uncharacterised protein [Candidatus Burarchaeum australiense]